MDDHYQTGFLKPSGQTCISFLYPPAQNTTGCARKVPFDTMIKRCILFLIMGSSLSAQFPGESTVWEGVYSFYNYDTEKAVSILTQAREDYPEHPAVHLTWAAARYLHNQANQPIEYTYEILEEDLMEIIQVYHQLCREFPQIPEYELFLGSAIGFRARVHLGKKEWIRTLIMAYQGFQVVTGIERKYPDLKDNYLPIGVVEYVAGISGPIIRFASSFLGFSASKDSGLEKIRLAADEGPYSWIEASSILSFLSLWVEHDLETAHEYSGKLVTEFPDNYYFRIIKLESAVKLEPEKSYVDDLKNMEERLQYLTGIQKQWYTPFLNYEKALVAFNNGDHAGALHLLEQSISQYAAELDMVLGECYLLRGRIYELEGQYDLAAEAYRSCVELNNNTYAVARAAEALERL